MLSPLQRTPSHPPVRSASAAKPSVSAPADSFVAHGVQAAPGRPVFAPTPGSRSPDLGRLGQELAARIAGPVAAPLVNGGLRPPEAAVTFCNRYNVELGVSPEGMQEREENMRKSPATFFRMFPSLFHDDLRGPYSAEAQLLERPAPRMVINGDSHLGNYGTLRDTDDGIKWALNDYDQAGPGSPERDLERLATSIVLLGQEAGLSHKDALKMVGKCAASYLKEVDKRKTKAAGLDKDHAYGPVKDLIEKAAGKTHAQMIEKFAEQAPDGAWVLRRNEDLAEVPAAVREAVAAGVAEFETEQPPTPGIGRPLEILDVAAKLGSGGSSKGLQRYYVLLAGVPEDPLPAILELKQILPCPIDTPSGDLSLADPDQTVVHQAALGGPKNPLNGAVMLGETEVLAREREGEKLDLKLEKLTKAGWEAVVEQAGTVMAQAHCFAPGNREALQQWIGADGDVLSERLTSLARHYAEQARADFAALA